MALTDTSCTSNNVDTKTIFKSYLTILELSKCSCFVRRRLSLPSDVQVAEKPARIWQAKIGGGDETQRRARELEAIEA